MTKYTVNFDVDSEDIHATIRSLRGATSLLLERLVDDEQDLRTVSDVAFAFVDSGVYLTAIMIAESHSDPDVDVDAAAMRKDYFDLIQNMYNDAVDHAISEKE